MGLLRMNDAFLKLEVARVAEWRSWIKSDLLNEFSEENFKALSKSPLFEILLKDWEVEEYGTSKWEVEGMIEHIDKIPSKYICNAIITEEKYRIPIIIGTFIKCDVGDVEKWKSGKFR